MGVCLRLPEGEQKRARDHVGMPGFLPLEWERLLDLLADAMATRWGRLSESECPVLAVGEVDWATKQFQPESYQELDHGLDYYAPQSLEDDKGRRICIGWMQMWGRNFPTDTLGHNWTGSMTIPRELKWEDGKLKQYPIGIEAIADNQGENSPVITMADTKESIPGIAGDCGLLTLKVDTSGLEKLSIHLRENENERTIVYYDKAKNELGIDRSASGIELKGEEAHSSRQPESRVVRKERSS